MKVLVIGAVRYPDGSHGATGYRFEPDSTSQGRFAIIHWDVSELRAAQIVHHLTTSDELLFEDVPDSAMEDPQGWIQSRSWIAWEHELWTTQSARHYSTFPAHLKVAGAFAQLLLQA